MKKAVFLLFILLAVPALWAQNRHALVIGNANYAKADDRLPNAINDTNDISAALKKLGYDVALKQNLQHLDMIKEIDAFIARLKSSRNSEGFFWYAGHAMEINGENLLLPLNVNLDSENLIKATSYSVTSLTRELDAVRNKINVLVLDACRVPPAVGGGARSMGDTSRVIKTVPVIPPDLFVIFSTAPGTTASDGTGKRNSPFAEAFLKHIASAEPLTLMVGDVTSETLSLTGQRQRPYTSGSMGSENIRYSLNPAVPAPRPAPTPQPAPVSAPAPVVQPVAPPIPQNVRAGTPGPDNVTISWDSAGSGMSYKVYYNIQNDPSRANVLDNPIAETVKNVHNLNRGTDYYFWVTSIQNGQESGKSSVVSIKTASFRTQTGNAVQEMQDPGLSAAHYNLPIGSKARIRSIENGREIEVTITQQRAPSNRHIIDLSPAAAAALELGSQPSVIVTPLGQ